MSENEEWIYFSKEDAETLLRERFKEMENHSFIDGRTKKQFNIISISLMPAKPELRDILWGKFIDKKVTLSVMLEYALLGIDFTLALISLDLSNPSTPSNPIYRIDYLRYVVDADSGELALGFGVVLA